MEKSSSHVPNHQPGYMTIIFTLLYLAEKLAATSDIIICGSIMLEYTIIWQIIGPINILLYGIMV